MALIITWHVLNALTYAKNDHLSFQMHYLWQGSRRRYISDFIVRLANGKTLALEIKRTDSQQNKAKREALDEWVRTIHSAGGFGQWSWDVAFDPAQCTTSSPNMPLCKAAEGANRIRGGIV